MTKPPFDSLISPNQIEPRAAYAFTRRSGQRHGVRRTTRRLTLAAIALAATLAAGLLFGAQRAAPRGTQAPAAAAFSVPGVGGADPELRAAAPAPADAPRLIVQALAGRAGSMQSATTPATAAPTDSAPAPDATGGEPDGAQAGRRNWRAAV